MVFNYNNYLDIWNIIVYEIVGSLWVTIIIGLVLIAYFTAKYAIPYQTSIALTILYLAVIVGLSGQWGIWVMIGLFVGAWLFWIIGKAIRRS